MRQGAFCRRQHGGWAELCLAQGAYRLRQIGKGQTLTVLVPPSVWHQLQLPKRPQRFPSPVAVFQHRQRELMQLMIWLQSNVYVILMIWITNESIC